MNIAQCILAISMSLILPATAAHAQYDVNIRNDIVFAEHDGVKLLGDLYSPKGLDKAPILVAVHGGGWQVGNRKFYLNWGPYLAKNGYAVFAIEYRLMKPGVKTYPGSAPLRHQGRRPVCESQRKSARHRPGACRPRRRQCRRSSLSAGRACRRRSWVFHGLSD